MSRPCAASQMRRSLHCLILWVAVLTGTQCLLTSPVCGFGKPAKISPEQLTRQFAEDGYSVHYGDLSLAQDTSVTGDIVVLEGSLDLGDGSRYEGNAWIINGDLIIGGRAAAQGNFHIVNGEVFQSRDATIKGHIRRYTCLCALDRDHYRGTDEIVFVKTERKNAYPIELSGGIGPQNRVDYLSLHAGVKRGDMDGPQKHWRGRAHLIAPLRDNTRGYLGFDLEVLVPLKEKRFDLHIRGFKRTTTNDDWQYTRAENSWAGTITHNDFFDYYERSGGYLGVIARPYSSWRIDGGVYIDHSTSLVTKSSPALFNNDRPLRNNPPIDEGEIAGATIGIEYDTRLFPSRPSSAWYARVEVDAGADVGPGDFEYSTVTLDVRRYNRLLRGLNLDVRGRIFTTRDNIPRQRTQSLNGYGGVRGLHDIPFDDRRGDRLALFSAELRIGMPQIRYLEILYTRWNVATFIDVGILKRHGDRYGAWEYLESDWDEWGKSVGIGISGESFLPYLGFYVAQDLSRDNKRPRFIVRFARSF
ncbi:MAG: BamA/TamA family outer membrane protein [candidate division Zixibacteria bacterium]|nr:BamA/TamA family outer membrane protein [candidate division Zixibacteria bacterium]